LSFKFPQSGFRYVFTELVAKGKNCCTELLCTN
jgi:hypothetical protein